MSDNLLQNFEFFLLTFSHNLLITLLEGGNVYTHLILLPPCFSYKGLPLQNLRSPTCTDDVVGGQLLSQR